MAVPVSVPYGTGTVPAVIAWVRQTRRRVHRRLLLGYNRVEADVSRLDCLVFKLCLINSCVGAGGHHFESGCDANSNTHVRYVLRTGTVRYVRKCVVAGTIALWQDSARLAQLIGWSASSSYPAQWPPTCHLARIGTQRRPIVALFPSSLSYACRLLTQIPLNHYSTVVFLARKLPRSKPTMAEIGLVTSIITVLQLAGKVTSLVLEYGTAIKHASGDLRQIKSEVNNISSLLRKVENMAKRLKEWGCSSEQ